MKNEITQTFENGIAFFADNPVTYTLYIYPCENFTRRDISCVLVKIVWFYTVLWQDKNIFNFYKS